MTVSSVDDSLNNTKNRVRDIGRLYLVGVGLVVLGYLLPWWCYGDFVSYCTSGVSIVSTRFGSSIPNLGYLFVGIILLVVVGLVYQSLSSSKSRILFLEGVSVFVLGYLIFNNLIVIENADASLVFGSIGSGILDDGIPVFVFGRPIHYVLSSKYLVLLLTIIIVWMVFYPPKFVDRPDLITAVLGGILVFVSGYQLAYAFYWQAIERNIIGGLTVAVGLPLILIGSILIVIAGVKKTRSEHYDQTAT